jgi:AcrR family transcriptional regulator
MAEQDGGSGPDGGAAAGRERVGRAAYDLFSRMGIRDVGVKAVVDQAGTARMTLYRNFPSKDDLALDFLARREEIWTQGWLVQQSAFRADTPQGRLLAIFELFDEWFQDPEFEGCSFITTLLEFHDQSHPVRLASVVHLGRIRAFLEQLATAAGVADPVHFARQWHILMKGSIVARQEGDRGAAKAARELGVLLLARHGIPIPD